MPLILSKNVVVTTIPVAKTPLCMLFFFFNDTATTQIYTSAHTLSLHDALPIYRPPPARHGRSRCPPPCRRRSPRRAGRSEEHTSEPQSRTLISYAVSRLQK